MGWWSSVCSARDPYGFWGLKGVCTGFGGWGFSRSLTHDPSPINPTFQTKENDMEIKGAYERLPVSLFQSMRARIDIPPDVPSISPTCLDADEHGRYATDISFKLVPGVGVVITRLKTLR